MSSHPYKLLWFDHNSGIHGGMVAKGFDTIYEASSYMLTLMAEDERIEHISLRRLARPRK